MNHPARRHPAGEHRQPASNRLRNSVYVLLAAALYGRRTAAGARVLAHPVILLQCLCRLFSTHAIDERCGVRHAASVIGSLRAWARTLEAHERACTGRTPIVVTRAMYHTALLKASLAMTRAPSLAELHESVDADWVQDGGGAAWVAGARATA